MNKAYLTTLLNGPIIPPMIACSADQYHGEVRATILEMIGNNHPRKAFLQGQLTMLDKMYGATPKASKTVSSGG